MSAQKLPYVSIIMPVRNEASFIQQSLAAVLAQEYPAHLMEVIVVDGMSDDRTREVVCLLQASSKSLRLIDNPGMIVPTGMNRGIRQARGDVILRVDGHTIIASDYIKECVAALHRSKASNVGGPMTAASEGRFGRATALATSSPFGVGGARFHYSNCEEWVDTVYLGAWPRDVFCSVGLFDEEQIRNQDDEFNYRLLSQGGRILLSPKIKSRYYNRSTVRSLWRQYFQYGYWKVRVMQKHPRQMRARHFVPLLLIAAVLLSAALWLVSPFGRWSFLLVAGSYILANLLASFVTALKRNVRLMPFLPVAFAAIHLSYGLGTLIGLIKFRAFWNQPCVQMKLGFRSSDSNNH
jgi:glycosyltransferase involved in cell wall biosynthesis